MIPWRSEKDLGISVIDGQSFLLVTRVSEGCISRSPMRQDTTSHTAVVVANMRLAKSQTNDSYVWLFVFFLRFVFNVLSSYIGMVWCPLTPCFGGIEELTKGPCLPPEDMALLSAWTGLIGLLHLSTTYSFSGGFPWMGVPQDRWFIVENSIKVDDLGIPGYLYLGNLQLMICFSQISTHSVTDIPVLWLSHPHCIPWSTKALEWVDLWTRRQIV